MQIPGGLGRASSVVAPLHDDSGDVAQLVRVADQLTVLHPPGMDEEMVLDAGEGERVSRIVVAVRHRWIRQESNGFALPLRPGGGATKLCLDVIAGETLAIGGHQVAALGLGDRRDEMFPFVGKQQRGAILVVPFEFPAAERKDAAQHQLGAPLRVGFGIGERQGRAPRAAEHQPALEAHHLPQLFDVGDEVPGGVVLEAGKGQRTAAAALVEQHDVVFLRIEDAALARRQAAAGTTVQEHRGLCAARADAFPIDPVAVADVEQPRLVGLDLGVEGAQFGQCSYSVRGGQIAVSLSGCWWLTMPRRKSSAIGASPGWRVGRLISAWK